jgi:chorismate-pyruvate lyase
MLNARNFASRLEGRNPQRFAGPTVGTRSHHKALQKAQSPWTNRLLAPAVAIFYAHAQREGSRTERARSMNARRIGIAAFGLLPSFSACLWAADTSARDHRIWADNFESRLEILALIETLNADLLASRSATDTLTQWCAAHNMSVEPKIVAHRDKDAAKPLSPAQRQDLGIGAEEPVVYRHVELACGDHVLSEADNWYVPSRLTPEMNRALTTSDVPFGRVVRPLQPRRQTIAVTLLWQPLPSGWDMQKPSADHASGPLSIPPLLFEHRAVVTRADGQPIAEVDETYRADVLDFPSAQ